MFADSQPGHIDQIKQINAGTVYRLIDRFGPISRIELSKKAQLAPASITKIVREMVEAHLVQETEFQEPGSRGRPAIGLVLDTQAWHFLSVRISGEEMLLTLRDLSCKPVAEQSQPLPVSGDEPLLTRIIQLIDNFFIQYARQLERLTAIAITLPGIVNSQTGVVHRMPRYDVSEMTLGSVLEERIGVPVFVQHDVCAWTMAESLFGAARDCNDVIQVVIDSNVGAGVITGGRLLHSGSRARVEIGHTQVDPWGKRCYCGNNGCLETIASTGSMLELAAQRMQASMSSLLHNQPLSIESLCDAALAGDALAVEIISGVGNNVGRIVAIMVNLFNPQKVLIGSPLNRASNILFPAIETCIRQQSLPDYSTKLLIEPTLYQDAGTMPGAALVKDALYNGSLLVKLLQG